MAIGIIGYGIVGRATGHLFRDIVVYDPPKGFSDPSLLRRCTVVFLTVPTPSAPDGRCDVSILHQAVNDVAPVLSERQVVAVRSTVPPGTTRELQERFPGTHFASNPEFLRSHRAEEDALRPSRVVIGADSVYARQTLLKAYYSRLGQGVPYLVTDSLTAEFIKYAANCFLATKITFAGEMRRAAGTFGAQFGDIVRALSLDQRIGGGEEWDIERLEDECLPKDLSAFVHVLNERQSRSALLETVRQLKDETSGAAGAARPEELEDAAA